MKQEKINQMRKCSHLLPDPGGEVVRECLEEIERLQAVLSEYANIYNWNEDSQGIRRVWLEPRANDPATYNGFEKARLALDV